MWASSMPPISQKQRAQPSLGMPGFFKGWTGGQSLQWEVKPFSTYCNTSEQPVGQRRTLTSPWTFRQRLQSSQCAQSNTDWTISRLQPTANNIKFNSINSVLASCVHTIHLKTHFWAQAFVGLLCTCQFMESYPRCMYGNIPDMPLPSYRRRRTKQAIGKFIFIHSHGFSWGFHQPLRMRPLS